MPDWHVRQWQHYHAKVPPLEDRVGFYLCQIAAILINVNHGKGTAPVKVTDLDPWFDPWREHVPDESAEMAALGAALKPSPE